MENIGNESGICVESARNIRNHFFGNVVLHPLRCDFTQAAVLFGKLRGKVFVHPQSIRCQNDLTVAISISLVMN